MNTTFSRRARALSSTSFLAISAVAVLLAAGSAQAAETPAATPAAPAAGANEPQKTQVDEATDFGTRVNELVVSASKPAAVAPATASLATTEPQSIISHSAIDQFVPATGDFSQIAIIAPSMGGGAATNGPGLSETKVTLRGFQDGQYNITYDGIPFGDANGPTHHSTSFFPSSTIGAVVVDRGPGEAGQLGTANFGGSINLFSPEVSHNRGAQQTFTSGSWDTYMSVTKIQTGDIAQLNNARVLLNFQELATNGALTNSGAKAQNQLVRAVVPINDKWDITLFSALNFTRVYTNDNSGATLAQVATYGKNFALTDNDISSPTYYKYNVVRKHTDFNYIRLRGDVGSKLHLEDTIYSYHYFNDTESTVDPTLDATGIAAQRVTLTPGGTKVFGVPAYTKLNAYRISGAVLHADYEAPFGTIKAGLWAEHSETGPRARYDYDALTNRAKDYRQAAPSGTILPTTPRDVEYLQYGGWNQYQPFVDVEWHVTDKLTLTPGVKYMSFDLSIDSDINQKTRSPLHTSKTFSKTLEFLTANYKIADDWSAYGQFATGFLVPDISIFQVPAPNTAALKPQSSTNYQLGTVFHRGKLSLDADVYYITFRDLLTSTVIAGETVYDNIGGATYKGVEGQVSYLVTDNLSVFANGSINSAKSVAPDPFAGKQIKNAPESTAAVGILYRDSDWTASVSDKYNGKQWADSAHLYPIAGFHSLDVKVTRNFGKLRLEAAVYDLTDSKAIVNIKPGKTVPFDQYYYQPGRNVELGVRVNF